MSKIFKITVIVLAGISIILASLAVAAFIGKENEHKKRLLVEDKLAGALKEKRLLEEELDLNTKALKEKELKLAEMEIKVEGFLSEIEELKEEKSSMLTQLDEKLGEIAELTLDLEKEKKAKLELSKNLKDVQLDYEKAVKDIEMLKDGKVKLEEKLASLEAKSVNLDTIVVGTEVDTISPQTAERLPEEKKPLKGKVLVVNKDYSFVVTDLGKGDGVKEGMVFEIRDGNKLLATARVDKLYDTMSSVKVSPAEDINNIKKGNLVIETR